MPEFNISIIIPTLNEADTIEATLQALQALRPACEILLVDGGSRDDTCELAKPWCDQVLISAQGRAKQMNKGAERSNAELLLFLHADTKLPEQAYSLLTSMLLSRHEWGRFDIALAGQHSLLKIIAYLMNWRSRLTGIATGDQAIFVTHSAFKQVRGYSSLELMEDIDLSKKLKKVSAPYCISAKVISSARRWEQFGVLKTIALMWSLRLRFFLGEKTDKLAVLYQSGRFW